MFTQILIEIRDIDEGSKILARQYTHSPHPEARRLAAYRLVDDLPHHDYQDVYVVERVVLNGDVMPDTIKKYSL